MQELIDRDLIFATDDYAKTVIASSKVGKTIYGSELEAREDGGVWLVSSRFRIGVMTVAEVCGVGILEGDGVVCSG